MRHTVDPHRRFRELISQRLDGALSRDAGIELRSHLAICPRCRMVERGYLRGRQLLRVLPPVPPPRDLWARTSAALDRELARRSRRRRRRHRDDLPPRVSGSPVLMLASMASLVLAVIVVGTQLGTSVPPDEPRDQPGVADPTPFGVATQALAFVEFTDEGIAIYEATVDRACPPAALDCADLGTARRQVVALPGARSASTLALHRPNGRLAFLTTDDRGRETVSVVFLRPSTVPPLGGRPLPGEEIPGSTSRPGQRTDDGGAGSSPDVETSQVPGMSDQPPGDTSQTPSRSDDPTPSGSAASSGGPLISGGRSPLSPLPSETATTAVVQEVLPDVHVVGAPPAWSADGEVLAFSAMPADRSRGPDVYTWRAGEVGATGMTGDHGSYFASWAGSRIVLSRAVMADVEAETAIAARTIVIDPTTGEERPLREDGLWLPAVDPTSRWAVVWRGELGRNARLIEPQRGALFVIDWRALDPFAAPGRPTSDASPESGGAAQPGATPDGQPPKRDPRGGSGDRAGGGGTRGKAPPRREPAATPEPPPTTTPQPVPAEPVEPDRDATVQSVREWQVVWSDDGTAFGFWVSETPAASWGELAVVRVDPQSGKIDRSVELLPATLARRPFTIGEDRVAWVAPSETRAGGELRVRTWGSRGFGGLRIREFDVRSGTPAF